jgi:gamma-glutamyltranspeptidase/glutathione hydrolase
MCLDAPRWQWKHNKTFLVEPQFDLKIVEDLRKRGHDVLVAQDGYSFGRGQMIVRLDNGIYVGATESRTDGSVACW